MLNTSNFVKAVVSKDYDAKSILCIESCMGKILNAGNHPVMLLGKVQSGKTKTFLGVLAYAFDNGYDIGIILTKGTKALAQQTLKRLQRTFADQNVEEDIAIYDIMGMPASIPSGDIRNRKFLFVVKKEDDNLRKLADWLFEITPELGKRRVLLVDDEADLASVGFRKTKAGVEQNTISKMLNDIRERLGNSSFLQVTATPYSLYLQPDTEISQEFALPLRPAFTEIVPIHDEYVGGDDYFVASEIENSVQSFIHVPVLEREFDAIKKRDGRRLKLSDVLTSENCRALRQAIIDFLVGAVILRLIQDSTGIARRKYSMIVHTEQSTGSHQWQSDVANAIVHQLISLSQDSRDQWNLFVEESFDRLSLSFKSDNISIPNLTQVRATATDYVDRISVQIVNSTKQVDALLDDSGQLKLDSILTIFIGGQILDRGLTIGGMIAFYYGRNPKRFQQDTVLQHSRMYGARPKSDLPATRFYTSTRLYDVMRTIHEFDHALRVALENSHDQSVAFIMETKGHIRPCAPNKVMLSSLTSITPGRHLLPIGFQTQAPSIVNRKVDKVDQLIAAMEVDGKVPKLVDLSTVRTALDSVLDLLDFEGQECRFDRRAFDAAVEYLSKLNQSAGSEGKCLVHVGLNRNASRVVEHGRLSNIPYSSLDATTASSKAKLSPCLMLLRQNGHEANGWRGAPFWWPVLQAQEQMIPVVFSAEILEAENEK
jgi:hypothetical protein